VEGYFQPAGRAAWPLIYVEEFRADILSFGFAADRLEERQAASVFLYNVLLRFGVHLEGKAKDNSDPYGPIPVMLYLLLRRLGWFELEAPHAGEIQVSVAASFGYIYLFRDSDYAPPKTKSFATLSRLGIRRRGETVKNSWPLPYRGC